MKSSISEYLHKHGPCVSSVVTAHLIQLKGLTSVTARKQISRAVASNEIESLDGLFPKRERFLFLKKQFRSEAYWSSITEALLETGSAYGLALGAICARGGILPVPHFAAACGSPIAMKKRLSQQAVLDGLLRFGLVKLTVISGSGECVVLPEREEVRFQAAARYVKARLVVESVMLKGVSQWAKQLGIVSYDKVRIRDIAEQELTPKVANFQFDMTAPSYLSPLPFIKEAGETRPGFFVCDVLLGSKLSLKHVAPYLAKVRTINSLKNNGRCLFMMIADEFSESAFLEMKKLGVIPATPENLFGRETANALILLGDFIAHIARSVGGDYERIDEMMAILSRIQGASSQLQGDLFEYIVAEICRADSSYVELGVLCQDNSGRKADCDVFAVRGKAQVTFIECKGYRPYSEVLHEDVKRWIAHQVPVFFEHARRLYPQADINMEFWTTGKLSAESLESFYKFQEANKIRERYTITIREAHGVIESVRKTKEPALIRVFEKHFIDNFRSRDSRIKSLLSPQRLAGGDWINFDL